jgi:hypothetical protein
MRRPPPPPARNLVISFSPYTTANLQTKLEFKTTDSLLGICSLDRDLSPDYIEPILHHLIVHPDAEPFLQAVDPVLDSAPDYFEKTSHPIDLQKIRENAKHGVYRRFSEFVDDVQLLVANACTYNPPSHQVHRAALAIRDYFGQLLSRRATLDMAPSLEDEAARRIGAAINRSTSRRRELRGVERRHDATVPREAPHSGSFTDDELRSLVADMEKLKSAQLIGVIEIACKRQFDRDMLPRVINLRKCEPPVIERLRKYVSKVLAKDGHYYDWRPHLPADLQEIRDQYEEDLAGWLQPPA